MNSESLLNAIFAKDGDAAADAFNSALSSKLASALEVKKVEIASNLISPPPQEQAPVAVESSNETVDAAE